MKHFFLLLCVLLIFTLNSVAQETSLENPIAYRADDGNIYLTDLAQTIAITQDATISDEVSITYTNPVWSANGQVLAFLRIQQSAGGCCRYAIFTMRSDDSPREIFSGTEDIRINESRLALSPDGSRVAFFASNRDSDLWGVYTITTDGTDLQFVAVALNGALGEGDIFDSAYLTWFRVTEVGRFRSQFSLRWNDDGILFTPDGERNGQLTLVTPEGEILWQTEWLREFILSPNGELALAYRIVTDEGWVTVDTTTGAVTALALSDDARPVGWLDGQVLYRLQSNIISVDGDLNRREGELVYDFEWGYFTAISSTNAVYLYDPEGEDTLITTLYGYDIGLIWGDSSNTMLVRNISSNVPAVLALNEGASAESVSELTAREQPEIFGVSYKESGINAFSRQRIEGSQASINPANFVVPNQ